MATSSAACIRVIALTRASWDTNPVPKPLIPTVRTLKHPPTTQKPSTAATTATIVVEKPLTPSQLLSSSRTHGQKESSEEQYLGFERWLPIAPKVKKPRSIYNAASLAYVGDCIYELYARRHFLFPPLSINEYNDRVMKVVCCEAQDALLKKLLQDDYLTEEERDVLRWGRNSSSSKTRTTKRAGVAVYNRASSLETLGEHDQLEGKFLEERAALGFKYQKLYEPLNSKRYEIVNGLVEVEIIENESTEEAPAEEKTNAEKGVPDFWLTAMNNNKVLVDKIQEGDEAALKYLKEIKWYRIVDPKGFRLEFYFDTNPFFKNSVLTKTFHMIDDDEHILDDAIGTEIEWYPGKCLTQKILENKPKKGSKKAKPITKAKNCKSFFNFFNPPQAPDDVEDIDEAIAAELHDQMEEDYDIGTTIRNKIIPHAVWWYLGQAAQRGDEVDDGDDEDEDEDEVDEDGKTAKKSGGANAGRQQADRPAECKEQ